MTEAEQKKAAKEFATYWGAKNYEKGYGQSFWRALLCEVLGIEKPEQFVEFEKRVKEEKNNRTYFIDCYIPSTKILIEQKSADKDLRRGEPQSNGEYYTPYEQAKKYAACLKQQEFPTYIITCNFKEFLIYDMNNRNSEPESILLKDLPKEISRLKFIVDTESEYEKKEMKLSLKAGDIVGELYDEILKQYHNPNDEKTLKSLNMLCVRLVFCLYAEDSGLFGEHLKFHNYLKNYAVKDVRRALIDLFRVLATAPEHRHEIDEYMDDELASFPYVNGGLFSSQDIDIPPFNQKIVDLLLKNASEDFDWSEISPTIFGAVFESTLNQETRRSGGMHYTSIAKIHKVINPLFLDDLTVELDEIKSIPIEKVRNKRLEEYRNKLASLTFFDPACGSGNFLTETYLSLRRLENEVLKLLLGKQIRFETGGIIKVSIGQFYGIEINDFAVTVARTALWIAESQMMKETEEIVQATLDFLPLKSYSNITEGNALKLNWEEVVPKSKLNYIMGNPPFVGARLMSTDQKADLNLVFGNKWKNAGNLDYVACWYKKCTDFIKNTYVRCALVSTNSITQGESVANLWKPLFENGVHIDFAHRTFRWDSEATIKAHVHCVIIGFSVATNSKTKIIYTSDRPQVAENINGYLLNGENIFIENRSTPLCNVPTLIYGSFALDDGNYTISNEEYEAIIKSDKNARKFLKPFIGAKELLHNIKRYCIWLKGISPAEIKECKIIYDKVIKVQEWRSHSTRKNTVELANTPTLFAEIRQPNTEYLAIPTVCSEKRKYLPIMFLPADIIASNQLYVLPNADLYHFGVLNSNVHNAWMRAVCGRLEMRYRYSNAVVYNNFPWCKPTAEQKAKIERTAQGILDARALYPDCSLADLYDEATMPYELRKAHRNNDKAVMQAYGFWGKLNSENECVAELMKLYKELTK